MILFMLSNCSSVIRDIFGRGDRGKELCQSSTELISMANIEEEESLSFLGQSNTRLISDKDSDECLQTYMMSPWTLLSLRGEAMLK